MKQKDEQIRKKQEIRSMKKEMA